MSYRLTILRTFFVAFLIKNVDAGLWARNIENQGPQSPPVRKPNLTCVLFYGDGLCAFKCRLFGQGAEGHCDNKACTCKYNDVTYIEGDNGFEPLPNTLTGRNFYAGPPVRSAYEEVEDDVDYLTPEENDLKIKLITMMTFSPKRGSDLCQLLRENKINIDDVRRLSEKEKKLNGGTSPPAVSSRSLQSETDILTQGNNIATKILQSLPDTCEVPRGKKLRSNPKVPPRKGAQREPARSTEDDDDDDDLSDDKLSLNLNSKSLPNHIDPQGHSHNPNRKQFTLNADAMHSPSIKMTSPGHKKVGKGKSPPKIKRVPEKPGRFSFTYPLARPKGLNSNHASSQKPEITDSQITPLPKYTVQPAVAEILPPEPTRDPANGDLKLIVPPKSTAPNLQVTGRATSPAPKINIPKGMRRKRKLKKSQAIMAVATTSNLLLKKTENPRKVPEEPEAEEQVISKPQERDEPQIDTEKVSGENSGIGKPTMLPPSDAESDKQITDGAPEKQDSKNEETQEQSGGRPNLLYAENTHTTQGNSPLSEAVPPAEQRAQTSSPSREELSPKKQTTDSIDADDKVSESYSTPLDDKMPENNENSQAGTNSRDNDTNNEVSPSSWSWPWGWFKETPTGESAAPLESPLSLDTVSDPKEKQVDSSPTKDVNRSDGSTPPPVEIAPQPTKITHFEVTPDAEGQREPQREESINQEVPPEQEPEATSPKDIQPQHERVVDSTPETKAAGSDNQAPPSDEPGLAIDPSSEDPLLSPNIDALPEEKKVESPAEKAAATSVAQVSTPEDPEKNGGDSPPENEAAGLDNQRSTPEMPQEEALNSSLQKEVAGSDDNTPTPEEAKKKEDSSEPSKEAPGLDNQTSNPEMPKEEELNSSPQKDVARSDDNTPTTEEAIKREDKSQPPKEAAGLDSQTSTPEKPTEEELNSLPQKEVAGSDDNTPTAEEAKKREDSSEPSKEAPGLDNQTSNPEMPQEEELNSSPQIDVARSDDNTPTTEEAKKREDESQPPKEAAGLDSQTSTPEKPAEEELDSSPQKEVAGSDDNTPSTEEAKKREDESQPPKEATGLDGQTSTPEMPQEEELNSSPQKDVARSDDNTPSTEEAKKREDESQPPKEATGLDGQTSTPEMPQEEELNSSPQEEVAGSDDNTPSSEEAKKREDDSQLPKEAPVLDNQTSTPEKPKGEELNSSPEKEIAGSDDNMPTIEEGKQKEDDSQPPKEVPGLDNHRSTPETPKEEELNPSPQKEIAGSDDNTPTSEEAKKREDESQPPKEASALDNQTSTPEKPKEEEPVSSPQKEVAGSDDNTRTTEEAKKREDESQPPKEAPEFDNQTSTPEKPKEEDPDSSPLKEAAALDREASTLEKPGSDNATEVSPQSNPVPDEPIFDSDPVKGTSEPNDQRTGPKSEDNGPHTMKSKPIITSKGTAVKDPSTPEELPAAQDLKDPKTGNEPQPHSKKDGESSFADTEEEQILEEFEDNDPENSDTPSQPPKKIEKPIAPKTENEAQDPSSESSRNEKHPKDDDSNLKKTPKIEAPIEAKNQNQNNPDNMKNPQPLESRPSDAKKEPEQKDEKTSDFEHPETEQEQEVVEYEDDSDDGHAQPITATKSLDVPNPAEGVTKPAKDENEKHPEPREEQEEIEQEHVIEDYADNESDQTSPGEIRSIAGEFDKKNNEKDAQKEPEREMNKKGIPEPLKNHEENKSTSDPNNNPAAPNIEEVSAPMKPGSTAAKATGSDSSVEILDEFEDYTPVDDELTPPENDKTTNPSDANIPQKPDGKTEKNGDEAEKNKTARESQKEDDTIKTGENVKPEDAEVQDLDEKEEILHEFHDEEHVDDAEPTHPTINKDNESQPRALDIPPAVVPQGTNSLSGTPQPENPEKVVGGKDTSNPDEETTLEEYTDEEVPAEDSSDDFFSRLRGLVVLKEYVMKALASETQ